MLRDSIETMRDDIIKTTQELVRIKSVKDKPFPGAPFGEGIKRCLDKTIDICNSFGFKTKNVDGYAGYAEYGEGEEMVGVLVHLDVVPEGEGWQYDPYEAKIVDGKIIGRGVNDNKGPAVASIYALKAIKDANIELNKKIRIIFGCDEESNWDCMKYYFQNEEHPAYGFSPDGAFPIINSEKGILNLQLIKDFSKDLDVETEGVVVEYIRGGTRANVVPDYCECKIIGHNYYEFIKDICSKLDAKYDFKFSLDKMKDGVIIKSFGLSTHGSNPENGKNAISQMLLLLNKLPLVSSDKTDYIKFIFEHIGMDFDGSSFGIKMEDNVSGKLSLNLGVININDQKGIIDIDIRYPVTKDGDNICSIIKEKSKNIGIYMVIVKDKKPLYVEENNPLVKKLSKAYEKVTGHKAKLLSISGGTYARAINNGVAFGPVFPDKIDSAHENDEFYEIEDLILSAKIYAQAMLELAK